MRFVTLGIQRMVLINSEVTTQMHIVRIGAQAFRAKRFDHDFARLNGFKYFFVGKYHSVVRNSFRQCTVGVRREILCAKKPAKVAESA
jgi:hypothetical protein